MAVAAVQAGAGAAPDRNPRSPGDLWCQLESASLHTQVRGVLRFRPQRMLQLVQRGDPAPYALSRPWTATALHRTERGTR